MIDSSPHQYMWDMGFLQSKITTGTVRITIVVTYKAHTRWCNCSNLFPWQYV